MGERRSRWWLFPLLARRRARGGAGGGFPFHLVRRSAPRGDSDCGVLDGGVFGGLSGRRERGDPETGDFLFRRHLRDHGWRRLVLARGDHGAGGLAFHSRRLGPSSGAARRLAMARNGMGPSLWPFREGGDHDGWSRAARGGVFVRESAGGLTGLEVPRSGQSRYRRARGQSRSFMVVRLWLGSALALFWSLGGTWQGERRRVPRCFCRDRLLDDSGDVAIGLFLSYRCARPLGCGIRWVAVLGSACGAPGTLVARGECGDFFDPRLARRPPQGSRDDPPRGGGNGRGDKAMARGDAMDS